MQESDKCDDFIRGFERFIPIVYKDAAGLQTIGYGHKLQPGETFTTISETQARGIFKDDVQRTVRAVLRSLLAPNTLNQNQFDAVVSLVFNIGAGNFQSSTLLKRLNEGAFDQAADCFASWNKIRVDGVLQVCDGLTRRRAAEAAMFRGDV